MSSSVNYLKFIIEQLSLLDSISYRPMMGEYIIYYKDKIIGGIYDDRFLIKPTKSAINLMPNASYEKPYSGAKDMILVDNVEDKAFLKTLIEAIYIDLPQPKKK